MERKQLGNTKTEVPVIGFGTWNYSGGIEPLLTAIDQGANLIDSAEAYGTEGVVGEAIRSRREQVFVATKALPRSFRHKDLISAAERSLTRLGTDYIGLYQLHWPNYVVPLEETMSAMEDLVDAGKIRFIGVSNFSVGELRRAQAALKKHRIAANQVRYSLVDRTIENGVLKYCQENSITVIAFSPLGTNFSDFRRADPQGVLKRVATAEGKTEVQLALNWLIANDNVVAIPKASSAAQVVEDCQAACWRLSDSDYNSLAKGVAHNSRGQLEAAAGRVARSVLQHFGRQL